jgi:SAM-dependent methyltransferase
MVKDSQDAHGHALYDYLKNKNGNQIVERDDGYFDSFGTEIYFSQYDEWPEHEKEAAHYARGSILDIGCGAGRHALYLQEKGFDVTGIDISSLAVDVCRQRGLKKVHTLSITEVSAKLGVFDTIIMFGNNFGLVETPERARWLLKKFKSVTSERGRILAETRDPSTTDLPEHLEYHEFNRKRGRLPGQVRIRMRYRKYVSPWFDFLIVSKDEIVNILEGTGWEARTFINGDHGAYVAVIEKIV